MVKNLGADLRRSAAAGLEYLLRLQSGDGSWADWDLPPGPSSTWTSGYVGAMLRWLPPDLKLDADDARRAAAQYLLAQQCRDGGWSYNEAVESDADSTAFAILGATSAGLSVPDSAYDRLREFQRPDGGFATYVLSDGSSWAVSHPDVTPFAVLALLTRFPADASFVGSAIAYATERATVAGLWNSFWWDTRLYSTEANLSMLNVAGVDFPVARTRDSLLCERPRNVLETALLASCLLVVDARPAASELLERLVSAQLPDGSWRSEPMLRITNRDCFEPWAGEPSGPLFADPKRIFTSATVLAMLSRAFVVESPFK